MNTTSRHFVGHMAQVSQQGTYFNMLPLHESGQSSALNLQTLNHFQDTQSLPTCFAYGRNE